MTFLGLPETSKMYMFTSIVQNLRTINVNAYVSEFYPSGLIFGGGVYMGDGGLYSGC